MWLSSDEWRFAQSRLPIACVDILPVRGKTDAPIQGPELGLIFRETPHQGRRWCLIGGRLFRNQTLAEAVARQLRETLGPDVRFDLPAEPDPLYIAQYFTEPRAVGGVDPRQHALSLIFAVAIEGPIRAQGEAIEFRWFSPSSLPAQNELGFDQHPILLKLIQRLDPGKQGLADPT